jgi:uncharacterized protein YjbI with pentapeptide repeats
VDLSDKEFTNCVFQFLRGEGSVWKRARLEDCVFEDCDLTRAQVGHARFFGATFRRSKLMGIDWSGLGPNPTVAFEECDLRYASFVKLNLRKTTFRACKAIEANFIECDMKEADFTDTDLGGTNFERSDLTKANFSTARNAFIHPARNTVKHARIPVESAVMIAHSFGMKVAGYTAATADDESKSRGRKR